MELGNYKINVTIEAESKEAQELFFELGFEWKGSGKQVVSWRLGILFTKEFQGRNCLCYFDKNEDVMLGGWSGQELTLPQLRDLVVLHRNDVNDANYTYSGKPVLKLDTRDYKVWDSKNNTWTEHVGSQTDLRKGIKPIQPEQGLISGADALRALANGEEVEYWCENDPSIQKRWTPIKALNEYKLSYFLENKPRFEFRLKPRTIKLNIEIPAPFEPKNGEDFYYLDCTSDNYGGWAKTSWRNVESDSFKNNTVFGAWRTEEEIKQVVSALHGALKNG